MFNLSTVSTLAVISLLGQIAFAQLPPSSYKRIRDTSADNLNFIGIETHPGSAEDNSTVSYHWCRVTGNATNGLANYDCNSSYLGCRQTKPYTYAEVNGEKRALRWRGVGVTALDIGLIALTAGGAAWAAGGGAAAGGTVTAVTTGTGGAVASILKIDGATIFNLLKPLGTWSVFGVSVFGVAKYVKILDPIARFDNAATLTYQIYGAEGPDQVKTLSDFGVAVNTSLCDIDKREANDIRIKAALDKLPKELPKY